jgi:hypothetical protein
VDRENFLDCFRDMQAFNLRIAATTKVNADTCTWQNIHIQSNLELKLLRMAGTLAICIGQLSSQVHTGTFRPMGRFGICITGCEAG